MKRGLPEILAAGGFNARDMAASLRSAANGLPSLEETLFVHDVADFLLGRDTYATVDHMRVELAHLVKIYPEDAIYADALKAIEACAAEVSP